MKMIIFFAMRIVFTGLAKTMYPTFGEDGVPGKSSRPSKGIEFTTSKRVSWLSENGTFRIIQL